MAMVKCGVDWCKNEVDEDCADLCSDCDGYYEECFFCGYVPSGDGELCRHLFFSGRLGDYTGCGRHYNEPRANEDMRKCIWAVLTTVGEGYAVKLRKALLGRHYLSYFEGFLIGDSWLNFDLGGRWSDGLGGMQYRPKDAPPDEDDPKTGCYLVPFPVPDSQDPGDVDSNFGKVLTDIAKERRDRDNGYDHSLWMDGVMWLVSLSASVDCQEAETLTVDWIESWLADLQLLEV